MRKSVFAITLIAVLSIMLAIFAGCKKDDNVVAPPDEFAAPSNPKANPDNGAVQLMWDASSSHTSSDFSHYRVTTYLGNQTTTPFKTQPDTTIGSSATTLTISGLNNGSKYTFLIQSVKTSGGLSQGVQIVSGPCIRYAAARIYEFDSPRPNKSAIVFSSGNQEYFSSVSPDNRGVIDLWIDGHNGAEPLLKSPSLPNSSGSTGWRTTGFAQVSVASASLNSFVDYPAASTMTNSSLTISNGYVYFAKTQDNHFVRFTVSNVQGTAPNRYVDVDISYNETAGNEFAKH